MSATDHGSLLDAAFRLADLGRGRVEPNPRVGCLALRGGKVVGRGYHVDYGGPHAEIVALEDAANAGHVPDALVVTLEPCSTRGKTPPCVDAILGAGVKRVVAAAIDPNPAHAGRGFARLREKGVEVEHAKEDSRFLAQNRPFVRALERARPFVIAKWAMSLDGRTSLSSGDSKWVSGAAAREAVHRLRGRCEAVAVGVGTVLRDDPLLTCRGFQSLAAPPARVVFDSRLRTPPTATIVSNHDAPTWIVALADAPADRRRALERAGAEILESAPDASGQRVDPRAALEALHRRGVRRLLLEAGPTLLGSMRAAGTIDQVLAVIAPKLLGGSGGGGAIGAPEVPRLDAAPALEDPYVARLGDDILIGGFLDAGVAS